MGVTLQRIRENSGIFHVPGSKEDSREHLRKARRSHLYTHLSGRQNLMYRERHESEQRVHRLLRSARHRVPHRRKERTWLRPRHSDPLATRCVFSSDW